MAYASADYAILICCLYGAVIATVCCARYIDMLWRARLSLRADVIADGVMVIAAAAILCCCCAICCARARGALLLTPAGDATRWRRADVFASYDAIRHFSRVLPDISPSAAPPLPPPCLLLSPPPRAENSTNDTHGFRIIAEYTPLRRHMLMPPC